MVNHEPLQMLLLTCFPRACFTAEKAVLTEPFKSLLIVEGSTSTSSGFSLRFGKLASVTFTSWGRNVGLNHLR